MDQDVYRLEGETYIVSGGEIEISVPGIRDALRHHLDVSGAASGTAVIKYAPLGMPSQRRTIYTADGTTPYMWDLASASSVQFECRAGQIYLELTGVTDSTELTLTAMGWR